MSSMISIIICTHNRENLVTRAIDSALQQNDIEKEVIVVDDASSDETSKQLHNLYKDRIKLVTLENNHGVAQATNKGYQCTTGKFIALLGDDDYWVDPLKLNKQLALFDERTGVVGSWRIIKYNNHDVKDTFQVPARRRELLSKALSGGTIGGSTPLISKEAWDSVQGMDPKQKKGTDSDLFRRIILHGYKMRVLEEFTTVSDKSHDLPRMTPMENFTQCKIGLLANIRATWNYLPYLILHPKALIRRIIKIKKHTIKLLLMLLP